MLALVDFKMPLVSTLHGFFLGQASFSSAGVKWKVPRSWHGLNGGVVFEYWGRLGYLMRALDGFKMLWCVYSLYSAWLFNPD